MRDHLPHGCFNLHTFLEEHVPDHHGLLLDPVRLWQAFDPLRKAGRTVHFIPARGDERSLRVVKPGGKPVDCARIEITIKDPKKRKKNKGPTPTIYQGGAPGSGKRG